MSTLLNGSPAQLDMYGFMSNHVQAPGEDMTLKKVAGFEDITTAVLPHLGGFFRNIPVVCAALLQVANACVIGEHWIDSMLEPVTGLPRLWPFMPWRRVTGRSNLKTCAVQNRWSNGKELTIRRVFYRSPAPHLP